MDGGCYRDSDRDTDSDRDNDSSGSLGSSMSGIKKEEDEDRKPFMPSAVSSDTACLPDISQQAFPYQVRILDLLRLSNHKIVLQIRFCDGNPIGLT